MISKEIASAAIQIAEEFDRRNLVIAAHDNTEVSTLVGFSTIDVSQQDANETEYIPNPDQIYADSTIPGIDGGDSTHTEKMEWLIDAVAEMVTKHLSFAKNVVAPLVKQLATEVNTALSQYPESATFNPEVIRVSLPEALIHPSMQSSLSEYGDVPYEVIGDYMDLPNMSAEQIIEMMKVGSKSVDGEIMAWAAERGNVFFTNLWEAVFTKHGASGVTFESLTQDKIDGADAAFAVFLLCKRLLDEPPEGTVQALSEYRKDIGRILNQAGLRLNNALKQNDLNIKTELLILKQNKDAVFVFAPVYDGWLSGGGNNAILFGNLLDDRPALFLPGMLDRSAQLINNWEHQNRLLTITLANNRFVFARATIQDKAIELIANNLTTCFGEYTNSAAINFSTPEVAFAVKNIKEYVDGLTYPDMKNIWTVCGEIVSKHIFYYTDAFKILTGIERACQENPGIDVAEAALLSANEYVTDFICDQLYVTDI